MFNGVRKFTGASSTAGLEVCSVVSCAGDNVESCGSLYPDPSGLVKPVTFDSLIISRHADLSKRTFYAPTTLVAGAIDPMNSSEYAYLASGRKNSSLLMMYLVNPRNDIMTFGIYGRNYDRDGEEETKVPSGTTNLVSSLVVVLAMLFVSRM